MKFFIWLGHPITPLSLHLPQVTEESTSGIYHSLDRSKLLTTKKMAHPNCYSFTEVRYKPLHVNPITHTDTGHTARPTDFCWASGESENWTAASVSEDNVVMVWQPTMRVWAGDEVKVDEQELESDAMQGIESSVDKVKTNVSGSSLRSQSMSVSATSADD